MRTRAADRHEIEQLALMQRAVSAARKQGRFMVWPPPWRGEMAPLGVPDAEGRTLAHPQGPVPLAAPMLPLMIGETGVGAVTKVWIDAKGVVCGQGTFSPLMVGQYAAAQMFAAGGMAVRLEVEVAAGTKRIIDGRQQLTYTAWALRAVTLLGAGLGPYGPGFRVTARR